MSLTRFSRVAWLCAGVVFASSAGEPALAQNPPSRTKPAAGANSKTKPADETKSTGDKPTAGRTPLTAEEKASLNAIRSALASRDLRGAKSALDEALKHQGSESYQTDLERLALLHDYVTQFWKGVERGMKTLQALDELEIGDSRAAVVEVTADNVLILRVGGENRRRTMSDMPPKLAVTLALRALDQNDPAIRVVIGAFWAMDGQAPDPAAAKRLWSEAAKQGVDVSALLPELSAEGAKVVAAPKLSAAEKLVLSPNNWMVRSGSGDRVKRAELGNYGRQNNEGRLDLNLAGVEGGGQVVAKKRLTGDFRARAILQNVVEGQQFGLYSAGGKDGAWVVGLPAGTVEVEFARKGDDFTVTINGEPIVAISPDGAGERMAGQVGVSVPQGGACTIAAFELK